MVVDLMPSYSKSERSIEVVLYRRRENVKYECEGIL